VKVRSVGVLVRGSEAMMTDSRRKGRRFENEVVGVLRANGYQADRISEAGLPGPDIATFGGRHCEAKIRQLIPAFIRTGLRDARIFFFREDKGPIMVSMELDELFDLLDWKVNQVLSRAVDNVTVASGGEQPPL
jgi:Holliday junction resolvase